MLDALNSRAGQIIAGGLTFFVVGIGAWVWVTFAGFLGWLIVINLTLGSVAFWGWVGIELSRRVHAPRVIYDKGEKRVRVVDGQVLPLPAYPSGLTSLSLRHDSYPALPAAESVVDALSQVPPPADLYSTLSAFQPSPDRILLGLLPTGPVTCSLRGLSHVALASPTGGGKSAIVRLLAAQLLSIGVPVTLCDPHYTDFDVESGEDWRPIRMRLARSPLIAPEEIARYLAALVEEMHRRYDLRRAGQTPGQLEYIIVEELPAILAQLSKEEAKQVAADYGTLLREARKVALYLIVVAQDWLVDTIGTDGGEIRANLRTAYFAGGGLATARALLDPQVQLPEAALGRGVVYLRNAETLPSPALVRVPYPSNGALYRLLLSGPVDSDVPALPPLPMRQPQATASAAPSSTVSFSSSQPQPLPGVTRLSAEEKKKRKVLEIAAAHPEYKPYQICTEAHISPSNWRWVEQVLEEAEEATRNQAGNVVPLHSKAHP